MQYKYRCSAVTHLGQRCKRKNCIVEDDIVISEYCTQHDNKYNPKRELINCSICFNIISDKTILANCEHSFCSECIYEWIIKKPNCPLCRMPVLETEERNSLMYGITNDKFLLVNVNVFRLRDILSEDQYNQLFEIEGILLIENHLYTRYDFHYIMELVQQNEPIYQSMICNYKREYLFIDKKTAIEENWSQDEKYYKFIF
jgi:hypothetical protein